MTYPSQKQIQCASGNIDESVVVNDLAAKVGNLVVVRYETKKMFLAYLCLI